MPPLKGTSFHPPFAIPHLHQDNRRASVSSASSSSDKDSDCTRVPYKDETSVDDLPAFHDYPPRSNGKTKLREDGSSGEEEDENLLDEEERVGLMMRVCDDIVWISSDMMI